MDNKHIPIGKKAIETPTELDLMGFDELWNADYQQTRDFIQYRKSRKDQDNSEIELMSQELDNKNFDVQRLSWQISEREKELKNLYEELHKLIELNKKLNSQLIDFEQLSSKQEALIEMLSQDPDTMVEPQLPNFG